MSSEITNGKIVATAYYIFKAPSYVWLTISQRNVIEDATCLSLNLWLLRHRNLSAQQLNSIYLTATGKEFRMCKNSTASYLHQEPDIISPALSCLQPLSLFWCSQAQRNCSLIHSSGFITFHRLELEFVLFGLITADDIFTALRYDTGDAHQQPNFRT